MRFLKINPQRARWLNLIVVISLLVVALPMVSAPSPVVHADSYFYTGPFTVTITRPQSTTGDPDDNYAYDFAEFEYSGQSAALAFKVTSNTPNNSARLAFADCSLAGCSVPSAWGGTSEFGPTIDQVYCTNAGSFSIAATCGEFFPGYEERGVAVDDDGLTVGDIIGGAFRISCAGAPDTCPFHDTDTMVVQFYPIWYGTAPTATPTPPIYATSLPDSPLACVTITPRPTSTRQATPTAFSMTPEPTATRGSATATPSQSYTNGPAKFDQTLSPWTRGDPPVGEATSFTEWMEGETSSNPGLAFIGDSMRYRDQDGSGAASTTGVVSRQNLPDGLVFSRPAGLPMPFRLSGQAKFSDPVLVGSHVYLRVWYLDADYTVLSGPNDWWVSDNASSFSEQSNAWRNFSFTVNFAHTEDVTHTVMAVGLSWFATGASADYDGAGMQVDNLGLNAGRDAVDASFPICTGTGGTGSQPPVTKQCKITQQVVDVFNQCPAPGGTEYLNVGAWLAFLWCRVSVYFTFNSTNIQQLLNLQRTQESSEPFGTILDFVGALGALRDTLVDVERANLNHFVSNRALDFGALLDWHALDTPLVFGPLSTDTSYLTECDELIRNISSNAQRTACFVVRTVRTRANLLNLFQWAIDLGGLIAFIQYVRLHFGPQTTSA